MSEVLILGENKPGLRAKISRALKAPFRRFGRKVRWTFSWNVCGFCGGRLSKSLEERNQFICEGCLAVVVSAFDKASIWHHSPTTLEKEQWRQTRIPKRVKKSMTNEKEKPDLWEYRRKSHAHGKNEVGVPLACGFDSCGFYEGSNWVMLPAITWRQYLQAMLQGDSITSPYQAIAGSSAWAAAQEHARQDLLKIAKSEGLDKLISEDNNKQVLEMFDNGQQRLDIVRRTIQGWLDAPKIAEQQRRELEAKIAQGRAERLASKTDIQLPCGHYVSKIGSGSFRTYGAGPGIDTRTTLCFQCYKRFRLVSDKDGKLEWEEVKTPSKETAPVGNLTRKEGVTY